MALEQITQKESFFQKVRSSLISKLAIAISAGTFALASCGQGPTESSDNDQSQSDKPLITQIYQGDIPIKFGKTNQDGQIFFTDEQNDESVTINVKDGSENTISQAPVAFFDGNGFETYQVNHPDFTPNLHIFSHNSSHELPLTSAPEQFYIYDGNSNENSQEAAQEFTDYLKINSQLQGCEFADEITIDARKRAIILGEISGRVPGGEAGEYVAVFGVGLLDGIAYLQDKFAEWGITENECIAYQTWANEDVSEWNLGPSLGLKVYGCMTSIPPENCNDGIDNDCDHKIDSEDSDCNVCSDECSPYGDLTCVGDSWKECGNFDSDNCLEWSSLNSCNSDETCQDGQCVDNTPSCSDECNTPNQRDCFGDGWKECNNFDEDSCLEWSIITLCGADKHCESGACVDTTCLGDNDCGLDYICKKSTGECLPEPEPLCTGSNCLDVIIHIADNGNALDDSFGLEIVGSFYGETEPGEAKTWTIPTVKDETYEMIVYGIGIPDGIGTYSIELTNATVVNGPPLSGSDLDAGTSLTWQILAEPCPYGDIECVDNINIQQCDYSGWKTFSCDDVCIDIGGYPDGADYCGPSSTSSNDTCHCLKTACTEPSHTCDGMYLTYCDSSEGVIKRFHCDTLCQDGGYSGASSCGYSTTYDHDTCTCTI